MKNDTQLVLVSQSAKALERVIRRKEMNRGQTTLLKYLYEDDREWVPREEIIDEIRWGDQKSFDGVLSAFSNRVNNTEAVTGSPRYEAFIERRDIDGVEKFRLRKEAEQAIERVDKLLETFERPMEELLDNQGVPIEFPARSIETTLDRDDGVDDGRWQPDSQEDRLLTGYWNDVGGVIVPEVHIGATGPGNWPAGSSNRRIDGLRFSTAYRDEITTRTAFDQAKLQEIVADKHVEVIEVKSSLNRPVIGQAIAGQDMFKRDYDPKSVEPVVICESGDPALEWVCRKNGIRVEIVEPEEPDE